MHESRPERLSTFLASTGSVSDSLVLLAFSEVLVESFMSEDSTLKRFKVTNNLGIFAMQRVP